jgi:hypothetical protein
LRGGSFSRESQAVFGFKQAKRSGSICPVLLSATSSIPPFAQRLELPLQAIVNALAGLAQMTACHVLSSLVDTLEFGWIVHSASSSLAEREGRAVLAANADLPQGNLLLSALCVRLHVLWLSFKNFELLPDHDLVLGEVLVITS